MLTECFHSYVFVNVFVNVVCVSFRGDSTRCVGQQCWNHVSSSGQDRRRHRITFWRELPRWVVINYSETRYFYLPWYSVFNLRQGLNQLYYSTFIVLRYSLIASAHTLLPDFQPLYGLELIKEAHVC